MGEAPYKIDGDIAGMRVVESRGLEQGVQRVKRAIGHARHAGVGKLLVDILDVDIGPPSVTERHWIMTEWASVGRGAVRMALVIRPEFFDPDNFGTIVAASRGLALQAFADEQDAIAWLSDGYDDPDVVPACAPP